MGKWVNSGWAQGHSTCRVGRLGSDDLLTGADPELLVMGELAMRYNESPHGRYSTWLAMLASQGRQTVRSDKKRDGSFSTLGNESRDENAS